MTDATMNTGNGNRNMKPKPEIFFYLWTYDSQDGNSNSITFGVFELTVSKKMCPSIRAIATTTDNRKWQYGRQNRKYLYLWNCDGMESPTANL